MTPEQRSALRRRELYGLDDEGYRQLIAEQEGLCAICGRDRLLGVDHCHTSGQVRGLLCMGCNRGIGYLGDDPELVQKALNYLLRWAAPAPE